MKQLSDKRLVTWQAVLIVLFSTCSILLTILIICGVCFETNDDRILSEIFSGIMTGEPDPHGIYVNYLLGSVISALFGITPSVQWWGVFLMLCFMMIYTCMLTVILMHCRNISEQVCFLILGCLIVTANIYVFAVIQFTTVAGALAVAGYAWLLVDKASIRKYLFFGIFEFLAILVRRDSMLMVQPIGLCVAAAFFAISLLEDRKQYKKCFAELGKSVLTIGLVLGLAWVGNYVIGDYSSEEWQEYTLYNDLNVEMADYYGYPGVDACKDLLVKYDITESEYEGLKRYLVLNNKFDSGFLQELSELAESNYKKEHPFSLIKIIKRVITYPKYDECYGYEISVTAMYIAVCFLTVYLRKIKYLLPVMALCGSKNLIFLFLVYRGRIPHRVVNILFFAELLLLAVIGARVLWSESGFAWKRKLTYITGVIVAAAMVFAVKAGGSVAVQKNTNTMAYADYIQQLFDYCAETEGGFIVSDEVTTYHMGHVLDNRRYQNRDFIVTGGWFSNSPMMDEGIESYIKEHSDKMSCITFLDVPGWDNSYVIAFFEQNYHIKPELVDTLKIDDLGLNYAVYQLY